MADRPNILWYCSDQQRFDTIGALNNPHVNTPRLDAFMQESVTFDHAYCQSPICTPSRSSFLTGMYPSAVGVNGNGNETWPDYYEERLLPNLLTRVGYHCGLVGKLHLAGAANARENRVDDGYGYFQYSHAPKGPNDYGHDYAEWLKQQGANPENLLLEYNKMDSYRKGATEKSFGGVFEPTEDADNVPPHLHQTFWCTEKSIEFIDKNRRENQPWMLSVNPFDPHAAFDPPYEYFRRYDPESMPGAHFEAERSRVSGGVAQALKLGLAGGSGRGIAKGSGVEFDRRRAGRKRGVELRRARIDEQADQAAGRIQGSDERVQPGRRRDDVEAAFGGQFPTLFRHQTNSRRAVAQGDLEHFVGRRHFKIERQIDFGHQPFEIAVRDMPPVLAQMADQAVGVGRGGQFGGAHGLRVIAATGVADRRHMIDIDAQPEFFAHPRLPSPAARLIGVTVADGRSSCALPGSGMVSSSAVSTAVSAAPPGSSSVLILATPISRSRRCSANTCWRLVRLVWR